MSLQIILSGLSFSYSSAMDVLADVSLTLSTGWTGVAGSNGSGKTTLLRVLAGELDADPSTLQRIPSRQGIRYCPQRVGELDPAIQDLAQSREGSARRYMGLLGLDPDQLSRWPTLSPGERKRWQIASALADSPDVLLLDEPTNHLDREAKKLLTEQFGGFPGIGVLVSHDRELLDVLTQQTLRISAGARVHTYAGNYTAARGTWLEEEEQTREALARLQSTRRKAKKRLDARRQSHESAKRKASTGSRMKGTRTPEAWQRKVGLHQGNKVWDDRSPFCVEKRSGLQMR
jgi:ATPase subunit of ABC transporter with duplicated ATPase domains